MVAVKGAILTPERLAKGGTEHDHQVAIFQWIALTGRNRWPELKLLFAVPNGGDRRLSVAAAMKAEGVKSGVPDMVLPVARMRAEYRPWHGLYLELKKPTEFGKKNGGRSDKQVEWQEDLFREGYAVVTAYGWQSACWVLQEYMEGRFRAGEVFLAPSCEYPPNI